jgi:hypothetical protein
MLPALTFYHLTTTPLDAALPRLVEKALASGRRARTLIRTDCASHQTDDGRWGHPKSSTKSLYQTMRHATQSFGAGSQTIPIRGCLMLAQNP